MKLKPGSLERSIASKIRKKKKGKQKVTNISNEKNHNTINSTTINIIIKYSEPIYDKKPH